MEGENPKKKLQLIRCVNWLQQQNPDSLVKVENSKSPICLDDEDNTTIPDAVDDVLRKPVKVSKKKLKTHNLHLQCEWRSCEWFTDNYDEFQRHVKEHIADVPATKKHEDDEGEYMCLWDICGHITTDCHQIVRHINYHAYHAWLMATGYNARATLDLQCCKKDSSLRNKLPPLDSELRCMWIGCDCEEKFDSVQRLYNHVFQHTVYTDTNTCSWGGCGVKFTTKQRLAIHVRSHTGEKSIACYHCGGHFVNNRKLADHLRRQNASASLGHICGVCSRAFATEYLLRGHVRRHIAVYACALCDMSALSLSALAEHVTYRHLGHARTHHCPHCPHKSKTISDLRKHIKIHKKREKPFKLDNDLEASDIEDDRELGKQNTRKKKKITKKYICHICSKKEGKIFSRGTRLTQHLNKHHGLQWPFGHVRFRYQISDDGYYRLTTTRYESLEVSKKIVDRNNVEELLKTSFDINIEKKAATETTPLRFEISLKGRDEVEVESKPVEITMCDVDEHGNVISSEVISDLVYTR